MEFQKSLFIFRRDLRLEDNTALSECWSKSKNIIPCFIFDPKQKLHDYFTHQGFRFLLQSIDDLDRQLRKRQSRLHIFAGKPHDVVTEIIKEEKIDTVFVNRDYTPFSQERDGLIHAACKFHQVKFRSCHDVLLNPPGAVLKQDGNPYKVYTPYKNAAIQLPIPPELKTPHTKFTTCQSISEQPDYPNSIAISLQPSQILGGSKEAQKILNNIATQSSYDKLRDTPHLNSTTHLSAHLKFGTISPRQVHRAITNALGPNHTLINQLHWRDFFTQIAYFYPHVFGLPFNTKYSGINWSNNKAWFQAWKEGQTGFPIVDAGMRELNQTGFMHNRVRMIVASFLVKDLHIDWRWGEKYFAQRLVDYDPCVNNGNWQWAASTGCDAQPYFRIFNPWRQQQKFDPDCVYIKRWIPEIDQLTPKEIHRLHKQRPLNPISYPKPIVNHKEQSDIAKAMFATVVRNIE